MFFLNIWLSRLLYSCHFLVETFSFPLESASICTFFPVHVFCVTFTILANKCSVLKQILFFLTLADNSYSYACLQQESIAHTHRLYCSEGFHQFVYGGHDVNKHCFVLVIIKYYYDVLFFHGSS